MAEKFSIEISAKDNYTQALTTVRNANRRFGDDLTGLSRKLDALNEAKYTLKVDTDKAYAALEKAQKKFDATGKAADRASVEMAMKDYGTAKRNLDLLSEGADQTEKTMMSMTGAIEKADNRASKSTFGKLAQSGLGQMAIDTATNAIGTFASSAYGSKTGNMVSSVVSGAASGAMMGSVVPGIGTAIGTIVGGISGAINAGLQDFKDQDEAFKAVVKDRYDSAMQTQQDALANGTTVAAAREQDRLRFSTVLGGEDNADQFLSGITDFAEKTPYDYSQLTAISGALLNYGYKQDEIIPLLTKVGDAGSALGLSADDRNGLVEALADMRSTGTVGQNDLAPFLKEGIDVWKYLAESSGKTEAEVQNLALKGKLSGKDAAEAIANGMGREYSGGMEKQSQTYAGLQENLQDAQDSKNAAMGKGYEDERKKGIQAQIDWLEGSSGKKMEDAYSLIGSWKASLDNDKDKAIRDAMDKAMNTNDYKVAEAAQNRKEMGRILAEAQAKGENEYQASKEYQDQLATQIKTIQDIRDDAVLRDEYWNAGKKWADITSEGFAKSWQRNAQKNMAPQANDSFSRQYANYSPDSIAGRVYNPDGKGTGHATGLSRVPYNNYPALLHEGEQVLTGVEARSGTVLSGVTVTGNTFNVRRESDIDSIASLLFEKIQRAELITP